MGARMRLSTSRFVCVCVRRLSAQTNVWQPSPGHTQIPIWPGAVPIRSRTGAESLVLVNDRLVAGKPWNAVVNVSQPTMTVYSPKGRNLLLNPNVPVTRGTPPTVLLQAENDPVDNVNHSLVYYIALKKAKVPWRCTCTRRADMPLGCDARSFRLRNGPSWWRSGSERSG